ncbi:MAG: hypothetical protein Q8S33_22125 [Myxococcales bacterium]|nr:hypothetical protein [Myxococcales bacterium]MDP3503047.1 hypothetical protein [Myxococcales bacterium]
MRTLLAVLIVGLALLFSGCGKKSSKEYFEAQRRYESLLTQEGEDAYLTVEMKQISDALAAVPTRTVEYERAQALVAKIATERARLEQERAAAARVPTNDAPPQKPNFPPSAFATPGAALDEVDAGEATDYPTGGMLEALFKEKYGACVSGPEQLPIEGQGQVPAYKVAETAACMKKLGVSGPTRFFFVKGALAGRVGSTVNRTTTIIDGGGPSVIPGQPYLGIPGAPMPGAVAPPPAPGALTPAGTGSGLQPTEETGGLPARTQ